jgi:hypothetical protein
MWHQAGTKWTLRYVNRGINDVGTKYCVYGSSPVIWYRGDQVLTSAYKVRVPGTGLAWDMGQGLRQQRRWTMSVVAI